GDCEVPALEDDESTPSPYNDTRDLSLNEDNRTAGPLLEWLRACLVTVVAELAAEERELRRRAQDAALRKAATRMEAVLNRHFQGEFRKSRTRQGDVGTRSATLTPDDAGELIRTGDGFASYDIAPFQLRGDQTPSSAPSAM